MAYSIVKDVTEMVSTTDFYAPIAICIVCCVARYS